MRFFTLYLTAIFLLLCTVTAWSQNYAVRSTVQLMPPYSVYLSDYATAGNDKLRVILQQGDLSRPVYQLRLVMTVELNGRVIMRTSRFFNPAPIALNPGVPTVISGAELAPYVDSRNIDFIGYSKEQYEKTKALPEGSYQITFTAYDYRRQDQQVSNVGSAFYYLAKNEPPLVNMPACGSKIPLKTPQQIVFSWMPRNTSSPTSAQETEYEFSLYETRPVGRNPNDVVLTSQPVFRIRTDLTQIIYGPAEPMLLDSMVYVWRVQAIDRSGKDAFRNNGYSEVCTFKYGGTDPNFDIGIVKGLQAIGETDQRAKIWWQPSDFDAYRVYYKKSGSQWQWFFNEVTKTEFKIFDLEPNNEYEVRVQGKKNGYYSPFTEIIKFRTREKTIAQCGDPAIVAKELGNPLQLALTGMTFKASDHDVTFIDVQNTGQPGWFKGTGSVFLPMLGGTYYVYFDRLYVNENREATGGKMHVASEGIAKMIEDQLGAQKDRQQKANQEQWAGTDFYEDIVEFNYAIKDIDVDASGNLVITKQNGQTVTNTEVPAILAKYPDKAVILQEKGGDQYVVQKDKATGQTKVTKVKGGGLQPGTTGVVASSNLDKMILISLRKYKTSIDEYLASNKQIQPGKGGGPSLFKWELEMFFAELPECLAGSKDQLPEIQTNLVSLVDSVSEEFGNFRIRIKEKVGVNTTQEKVDVAVCEALAEGLGELAAAAKKKGKLIVTIDNTTMTEGKVFIFSGTGKQIKIKYEISDTAKTKVTYQLTSTIASIDKSMSYPKTGYDTLIYNQVKEITLDSIHQGKYSVVCKAGKAEYKINFIVRRKKLEITKEQLKKIFPSTNDARIEEVVKNINAFSAEFDIGTPERMAHFIGQIGAETEGLKKLIEGGSYTPRAVAKTFPYPKYGHLFEDAILDSTTYQYRYSPINYDEKICIGEEMSRGGTVFPYKTTSEVRNAYAAIKNDTLEVTLNKKKTKVPVYKTRTDVTQGNIEQKVTDKNYNSGRLRVKSKFINSSAIFDVTYACRMGNGNVDSKDGSTFLGKGFIHITGKGGYKDVSNEWNRLYPNDKKEFHGKDITLLETDVKVAIKASLVYWKLKGLNQEADKGTSPEIVEKIGTKVNGGDNGMDLRKSYTKLAAGILK